MEEQKESQIKIERLEEQVAALKLRAIDESKYMDWEWEDVLLWILSMDNGRYKKYESVLRQSLSEEEVRGEYLSKVDSADIKGWGIKSFLDKKDLFARITDLVEQNADVAVAKAAYPTPMPGSNDTEVEGGHTALLQ